MSALSALPPPLITIRNETFFRVDVGWRCWQAVKACNGGWLCLTDAQRYYTTLQIWQVTGSADGCIPKWGRVSGYLWGVMLGCSARYSGQPQIWDAPRQMGCIQDIWRASGPILPATRGAGETPAIPGGYAIISNASSQTPQLLSPSEYAHVRVFLEVSQIHDRFAACAKAGLVQFTSIALFRDFHFKTQKD